MPKKTLATFEQVLSGMAKKICVLSVEQMDHYCALLALALRFNKHLLLGKISIEKHNRQVLRKKLEINQLFIRGTIAAAKKPQRDHQSAHKND